MQLYLELLVTGKLKGKGPSSPVSDVVRCDIVIDIHWLRLDQLANCMTKVWDFRVHFCLPSPQMRS